jgi:hypothetical protein
MSVSGLGTARTARTSIAPVNRPVRAEKPAARSETGQLTAADQELIHQVTGQRVSAGFDPDEQGTPAFAAVLAAERAAGRLLPGQEISPVYLKDLNQRYERSGGANPIAPYLEKALGHLARTGSRRIDVSA